MCACVCMRASACMGVCVRIYLWTLQQLWELQLTHVCVCVCVCARVCVRGWVCVCECKYIQFNNHGSFYALKQEDTVEMEVDLESEEGQLIFSINGRRIPNRYV